MKKILAEMRVKHYIKNIMVFFPIVFSLNLPNIKLAAATAMVFAAFCAASSTVYVINDIADAPKDRLHPRKKHRPIASGAISVRGGVILVAALLVISLALSFFASRAAFLCLSAYIALNILYSFLLKHYAVVDVFCVMSGFLLRVAAGAAAINVPVSNWLLLTIMSLSLFLGFGKRRRELLLNASGSASGTRRVLLKYTPDFLDKAIYSMMTLSITFYALWAIDSDTITHLSTDNLIWTTPLVVAGLLRYVQLLDDDTSDEDTSDGDPTNIILTDIPVRLIIAAYITVVIVIVYL